MLVIPDNCNYVEIVLVDRSNPLSLNLEAGAFETLMRSVVGMRYFRKESKSYAVGELTLENMFFEDIRVCSKSIVGADTTHDGMVVLYYTKEKKPYHAFPSTTSINRVWYTKKLVFRIHNRMYLNFEIQRDANDNSCIRKAYINYNHDSNVDQKVIEQYLVGTLDMLGRAPTKN